MAMVRRLVSMIMCGDRLLLLAAEAGAHEKQYGHTGPKAGLRVGSSRGTGASPADEGQRGRSTRDLNDGAINTTTALIKYHDHALFCPWSLFLWESR